MLGDFIRGVDVTYLPVAVRNGLLNHRAVDAFTDRHPLVREAKTLFSRQRRRFAGVALDVLFDHYLLRYWSRFSTGESDEFIAQAYRDLDQGLVLMPPRMQEIITHMITHDWLGGYRSQERVGLALDRIAGRIRFANEFGGIIDEIKAYDGELEAIFLRFFPELIEHVRERNLEPTG